MRCTADWVLFLGVPLLLSGLLSGSLVAANDPVSEMVVPDVPDTVITEAYREAGVRNVLAAVNPQVFPGYFSVCADGQGFGFGNSYPSLDGHQMTDALLWLGQVEVAKQNWDYVKTFQRADGRLPLAILPAQAGQQIGPAASPGLVAANGGLYQHWVPGDPLAALASPTYIQNADVIFRHTSEREWLAAQMDSVNLAADFLASITTLDGMVRGGGYYVERPTRLEADGVTQCYAIDAFRRAAALNRVVERTADAAKYDVLASRVEQHFRGKFWANTHFAEYWHPEHGFITNHGLTDVDWAAIATGAADRQQITVLWPQLRNEAAFYYGGMPTAISTKPQAYEDWEFAHPDRHDLASMGRVWYLESWARSRQGDAAGLVDTLQRVVREGQANGYSWRERYHPSSTGKPNPAGPEKYCEYPANFIRIVNQFLLGIDLRLDGSLVIAPTVPDAYWEQGFGHTVAARGGRLRFDLQRNRIALTYTGPAPLAVGVRAPQTTSDKDWSLASGTATPRWDDGLLWVNLSPATADHPHSVILTRRE